MSLFPWQDWFYHISQKEAALTGEYNRYISLCQRISANGAKLDNDINTLETMFLRNYALLIVNAQVKMSQSDYAQWLVDNHALEPANPKNSTAVEVMQGISDLVGIAAFGKLVWTGGVALKNKIWSKAADDLGDEVLDGGDSAADGLVEPIGTCLMSGGEAADIGLTEAGDALAESVVNAASSAGAELGTEAAIEATGEAVADASSAAVSAAVSGLAIIAAVGVDAILGAIQGSVERDQLDAEKAKLDKALSVTQDFAAKVTERTNKINASILTQQRLFENNMQLLNKIQAATFGYKYDATKLEVQDLFTAAMARAVAEYGWLSTIRTDYDNYLGNGGKGWSTFVMMMNMMKPKTMAKEVADGFLGYAKTKLIVPAE